MNVPKRFELYRAAAKKEGAGGAVHAVRLTKGPGSHLVATDGIGMAAVVPVLRQDDPNPGDLPQFRDGECDGPGESVLIDAAAVKEATKNKNGVGTLNLEPGHTEAQADDGKPWVSHGLLSGDFPDDWPLLEQAAAQEAPDGLQHVEVCLDAARLALLAKAIGAGEAVRLRFLVGEDGVARGEPHGIIEVRPIRQGPERSERGILMMHVAPGGDR